MRKLLILLTLSISLASHSQLTQMINEVAKPTKPDLTQAQWESFLDNAKSYIVAKIAASADTTTKFNAFESSRAPIADYSESYLESKMEDWYGTGWREAGGPFHTACQIIGGIIHTGCMRDYGDIWQGDRTGKIWRYCDRYYAQWLNMCGLLPEGL